MPETTIADHTRIRYDDEGTLEPALLFLPDWCVHRSAFDQLRARAVAKHRCITLDWPGHGDSDAIEGEYGTDALVDAALAVIEASGAKQVIPVALGQAGWIAVRLRRRLRDRVPALILLNWMMRSPTPEFTEELKVMQDASAWPASRDGILRAWTQSFDDPDVLAMIDGDMAGHGFEMWARASREVEAAYEVFGNPMKALASLRPPVPTLHLYSTPPDSSYLRAQEVYAATYRWFYVQRLGGQSHFLMLECPGAVDQAMEDFLNRPPDDA